MADCFIIITVNSYIELTLFIPKSVTFIEERAFYGCCSLKSITIPNSVTIIRDNAFENCSGLTSICIEDGDTMLNLGNYSTSHLPHYHCFYNCNIENAYIGRNLGYKGWEQLCLSNSLKYLVIGDYVTDRIADRQFEKFTSLIAVKIGYGVTNIGDGAFRGCTSLESFEIGDVNEIFFDYVAGFGSSVFDGCWNLKAVAIALYRGGHQAHHSLHLTKRFVIAYSMSLKKTLVFTRALTYGVNLVRLNH